MTIENQYVYIARLIDHKNEFIEGYYKLGKTRQYVIRETQLNSTHLPVDVQLIRVFETNDMSMVETLFHTCFEDYRVVKKYEDKRDKKTEWFFVDDEETLFNRIDKLVSVLTNVNEIDLISDVRLDDTINKDEKENLINSFRKSKSRLNLIFKNQNLTCDKSTDTYLLTLKLIAEQSSWNAIMDNDVRITKTFNEIQDRNPSAHLGQLKLYENHYFFTGNNNEVKCKNLNKLIKKLNIKDINLTVKK
jgi:hypothetical protein